MVAGAALSFLRLVLQWEALAVLPAGKTFSGTLLLLCAEVQQGYGKQCQSTYQLTAESPRAKYECEGLLY